MKIENYKGVDIRHNAEKDEFYTSVVIRKASMGKKDEVIKAPRLQRVRNDIDKFLNTAAKKPVLKKAWYKGKYHGDTFNIVDIILFNAISNEVQVKNKDGKIVNVALDTRYNNDRERLYLNCKENTAIISELKKHAELLAKIEKASSCSGGKLIPLKLEHFK